VAVLKRLPIRPDQLLGWVVPDIATCHEAAMQLVAAARPGMGREGIAREVIQSARRRAAAVGGATGMAASPVTMVPAAIADVAATLRIEGTMAGTVAALLDPASLEDPAAFGADVVTVVFPAAVSQALRQVGIRAGEELTKTLIRKVAAAESVETILKVAARILGLRVGEKAVLGKDLPLVSVGIGAGWNWLEVSAVGNRAVAYYTGRPIGPQTWRDHVKRLLPDRMLERVWRKTPPAPPDLPELPGPPGGPAPPPPARRPPN
jgi:hypothetical protein